MVITPPPRYLNPIDLFGLAEDPVGSIDPALLQRANRNFLDELRTSGYEEFGFFGAFYSPELLEKVLAEALESPEVRERYHRAARVEGLSRFLVDGVVVDYFDVAALHEPEMLPFLRDRFAWIYDYHTLRFFKEENLAALDQMKQLRIEDIDLPVEVFFVQTYGHLTTEILRLARALDVYFTEGASPAVVAVKKGQLPERTLPVAALAELPEYFGPLTDQIAEMIMVFSVRYAGRNGQLVLDLIYYAHQLPHLLEQNRLAVNNAYDQLKRKHGDLERFVGRQKIRRKPAWIRFTWIAAIILLLVRIASCAA